MYSGANQIWDIIFFQNIFSNLDTKPSILLKTTGTLAHIWKVVTLTIMDGMSKLSNLPCTHSYSRVTAQTFQRALLLFLVLLRVIDSSSTAELISTSSCYTLYLAEFCNHWMQKYIPDLKKKKSQPFQHNTGKSWTWACFRGCTKSKG